MKCNIKKDVTSKALYQSDLDCISEGLDLLEQDINQFLERKNFKEISQENALQNLEHHPLGPRTARAQPPVAELK